MRDDLEVQIRAECAAEKLADVLCRITRSDPGDFGGVGARRGRLPADRAW